MVKHIFNRRRAIKSSYDDAFTVYPWSADVDYTGGDEALGLSYVVEAYGDEFVNVDNDTLEDIKDDILVRYFDDEAFTRDFNIMNPDEQIESIYDIEEPEDMSASELATYFDYEAYGRDIRLGNNMVRDKSRKCWFSAQDIDEFENEDDIVFLSNSRKAIKSGAVKSARYVVTDENGNVIGEADTYDEAKTLGGANITDTEKMVQSSRKVVKNSKQYEKFMVRNILSKKMTEDSASQIIASRMGVNKAYAKKILSDWIAEHKDTLIKSDAVLEDIQKEFDKDGNLASWAKDYMPGSGTANTKGGELVRAAMRILNEFFENENRIGKGYGNEVVNPAARFIIETTDFNGNDEIKEQLEHTVDLDEKEYKEFLDRFEKDFEDYLREHEELFSEANDSDMLEYREDSDKEYFLNECVVLDESSNMYRFKNEDDEWKCTDIEFATEPQYLEGDTITATDSIASNFLKEEYATVTDGGFIYDVEAKGEADADGNFKEWIVVRVAIDGQEFELDEVVDQGEIEAFADEGQVEDANGNKVTSEDFRTL